MKDFFVSHNKADRAWAEWIAWQLEAAWYTTVVQAWDYQGAQKRCSVRLGLTFLRSRGSMAAMQGWDLRPWTLFSPSESPFYVDYAGQLEVSLALARPAYRRARTVFAFLFGYSGTGKSGIGGPLWWRLNNEGLSVSLLSIDSAAIASRHPRYARRALDEVMAQVNNASNYPLLILLDEADALAPDRRERAPSERTVCFWTISLLKGLRQAGRGAVVLACSNYPDNCDIVIRSEIGPSVYFPEASRELLEAVFRDRGILDSDEVAAAYLDGCSSDESVPFIRPVVDALENLRPGWRRWSPQELAEWMLSYGDDTSREEFQAYEDRYWKRIGRARRLKAILEEAPRTPESVRGSPRGG